MNRRYFIKLGTFGSLLSIAELTACSTNKHPMLDTEVLVAGGTPGGIMAAIAAARAGAKVTLVEYHHHIGGLSTSGLGKSDIENKDAIAGLFKEFTKRVLNWYVNKYGADSENVRKCREGYYYEPSVAEEVFNDMIAEEPNITLLTGFQIEQAVANSGKVSEVTFRNRETGENQTWKAKAFVDATYEGDLYALAGAAYRLGRESKEDFNEPHAGRIFFDYNDNVFLEGSTGEGDHRIPAYTYRLCLTDDPTNSYIMKEPPKGYRRENYLAYFKDLEEGRLSGPKVFKEGHGYYKAHFDTMVRVFSFAEIPNGKYDVNTNPRPLGFPFPEENFNYVEASWEQREKVFQRHRELALGLLYFIQNDPEVPEDHRKLANQYHLPLDEFSDNEHFPYQLYVREARRLKGVYTLTENDLTLKEGEGRTTIFEDSIIAGEFPIDSFPCSKEPSPDKKVLEGYIGMLPIPAYQLPYRVLIPETLDGVIVPVAASTTHVAYS
ncbi:MAG: FAD-dependent oxidoreductase, partial [Spirosomataceae bacterium]